MQKILQWTGSISEYQEGFKNLKLEKPEKCSCGCAKFHKWGIYERYADAEKESYRVPIQRICCIKCKKTYSYLPSFCVSGFCYSVDFIITILKALILKIKFDFGERKRRAYDILKRFVILENLWIAFLRTRGLGYITADKNEKRVKILTALLEIHENKNLMTSFLRETGKHFMTINKA